MIKFFLSGLAPLVAAAAATILWHKRQRHFKRPPRKSDYAWAFFNGGVLYVLLAVIFLHHGLHMSYQEILSEEFGEEQISVAFVTAAFEAAFTLFSMWRDPEFPGPPPT